MKLENNSYNYEKILSELKAELFKNISNHYSGSIQLSESDPLLKILEISSYRELLIRQKIQDTYNASLFSQAQGSYLKKLSQFLFDENEINNILNDNELRQKIDNLCKNNNYYTTGTQSAADIIKKNVREKADQLFLISKNIPFIELTKSAYQPGIISYKTQVDYQPDQKTIQTDENEIIVNTGEAFKLNNINISVNYQDK